MSGKVLGDISIIILIIILLAGNVFNRDYLNIPADLYRRAELACISLNSYVLGFDRSGEAVCENKASIDYKEFTKEKK